MTAAIGTFTFNYQVVMPLFIKGIVIQRRSHLRRALIGSSGAN